MPGCWARFHRIPACAGVKPSGVIQFSAAIPLGIYAASMTSRLRFVGVRAAGVDIAHFGGLAASFMMIVSALAQWAAARPGIAAEGALIQALYFFIFATGGPGYSVPLGLLCAGIAVPALFMRLLPRWLAVAGIALGVIGEFSALSLIVPDALFLVPLTRFPGFIWLIAAGLLLSSAHPRAVPGKVSRTVS